MDEILISATDSGIQRQLAITGISLPGDLVAPGLGFVVVWADASGANIKGQMLAANGDKIGDEFVVNAVCTTAT